MDIKSARSPALLLDQALLALAGKHVRAIHQMTGLHPGLAFHGWSVLGAAAIMLATFGTDNFAASVMFVVILAAMRCGRLVRDMPFLTSGWNIEAYRHFAASALSKRASQTVRLLQLAFNALVFVNSFMLLDAGSGLYGPVLFQLVCIAFAVAAYVEAAEPPLPSFGTGR